MKLSALPPKQRTFWALPLGSSVAFDLTWLPTPRSRFNVPSPALLMLPFLRPCLLWFLSLPANLKEAEIEEDKILSDAHSPADHVQLGAEQSLLTFADIFVDDGVDPFQKVPADVLYSTFRSCEQANYSRGTS